MLKNRSLIISLFALLLSVCITFGLFLSIPKKAEAASTPAHVFLNIKGKNNIPTDLATDDGGIDRFVLQNLFAALTGDENNATLQAVKDKLSAPGQLSANGWFAGFAADEIAELNKTQENVPQDLVLAFGGLDWNVVYLSLDRNGDPVVTLLLKDNSNLDIKNTYYNTYTAGSANCNFPSTRYSTSKLRAALNLGTPVSNGTNDTLLTLTSTAPDKENILAQFTMSETEIAGSTKYSHSLMKYIDMPYLVPYQEKISSIQQIGNICAPSNSPNDCYGIPNVLTQGSVKGCAVGERGYSITGAGNYDFNSYVLNNYIFTNTGESSKVTGGMNTSLTNNMDLSAIFGGKLYDDSKPVGEKWKKASDWTSTELQTARTWTDAESWAFDPVWSASFHEINGQVAANAEIATDSIWRASTEQRKYNADNWQRTSNHTISTAAFVMTAAGLTSNGNKNVNYNQDAVRPALHLNLAEAAKAAGRLPYAKPDEPYIQTEPYDGTEKTLSLPELEDAKYTEADGFGGTYEGSTHTIKATDAGEYKVTLSLPDDGIWKDGTTKPIDYILKITPAQMTVTFDNSGTDENKKQKRSYTYNEATTHDIELSKDIIGLTAQDKNKGSVKIYYYLKTHDEHEYADQSAHDAAVFSSPPSKDDASPDGWSETPPQAKDPGGYCVWFKIEADNHETYYGTDGLGTGSYISVHIYTEVLTIKVDGHDLGEHEYGEVDKLDNLGKLLQDDDGNPKYTLEYPQDSAVKDELDGTQIKFYLKDSSGNAAQKVGGRYPVGEYTLAAEWKDTGRKHFVDFQWNDNTAPKVTIIPKKATVYWKGEDGSAEDFEWIYDGKPHTPEAYFDDLDGTPHKLPIMEEYILTDVDEQSAKINEEECAKQYSDYDFKGAAVQAYKISPTPNSWEKESFTVPDWATCGEPPEISSPPRSVYGTVVIKYYSDEACETEITLKKGMTPNTYYARAEVEAESNFGGLIGKAVAFKVKDHTYELRSYGEEGHYGKCTVCEEETEVTTHTFTSHTKRETCTEDGYTYEDCECGFTKIDESTRRPARGHSMSNHYPEKQATATTAGNIEYYECGNCHKYFKDKHGKEEVSIENTVIPATGAVDPPDGGSGDSGSGDSGSGDSGSGDTPPAGGTDNTDDGGNTGDSGDGGSDGGSGSTGGNEGSINPPLGGDTGLSGSGSASDFLDKNLWWIIMLAAILIALIAVAIILSAIHSHRREKRAEERDRQFETFMKMQMMHTYGGMNGFAPPADGGASAVEGQPQAQLPYNQEMLNVAVAAAMQAMQAMKGEEAPSAEAPDRENIDVDGFYDDVEEDK